jgi:hypothetical protein
MPPRARKSTDPAPDTVETVEEVPDGDVQKYADAMNAGNDDTSPAVEPAAIEPAEWTDHTNTWPHEVSIAFKVPHVARSEMATQLLDAADELGYPVAAIRSQTDGFLVPSQVYYHLFPSQIPDDEDE